MQTTATISIPEAINFMQNLSDMNLAYLSLSVTILVALNALLVGLFYFFSVKPLKSELDNQVNVFAEFKKNIEEKIIKLNDLENKTLEAEKRILVLEDKTIDQTLENIWTQHYVAQTSNNHGGDILTLVWYLELSQKFKRGNLELCLLQIKRILDSDTGNEVGSVVNMSSWNPKIVTKTFTDMVSALKSVEGFDDLKNEIIQKSIKKWFNGNAPDGSSLATLSK